jgi:superfamily II DNA/RNA helicase
MPPNLPPDVQAYLIQATFEIMANQKVKPSNPEVWLAENYASIIDRARELNAQIYNKFVDNQQAVTKIVSVNIYQSIRNQK